MGAAFFAGLVRPRHEDGPRADEACGPHVAETRGAIVELVQGQRRVVVGLRGGDELQGEISDAKSIWIPQPGRDKNRALPSTWQAA